MKAIDPKTGKIAWEHPFPGVGNYSAGMLTTAGNLLFTGDPFGNFVAFDPANGKILWHVGVGSSVSNGPMTYQLDNRQYVVAAAGDSLYAFTLPGH